MCSTKRLPLLLLVASLSLLPANPAVPESARTEAVLRWDDGEPDGPLVYDGLLLAVEFQAPERANLVVGAHVYIWADTLPGRLAPQRTAGPVRISVPGGDPSSSAAVEGGYPVDEWLQIGFPEPVDITDPEVFPDRWFFVTVEWLHPSNPVLGVDTDDPVEGHSSTPAGPFEEFDVMVRAVVADTAATTVEPIHWGIIKSAYR